MEQRKLRGDYEGTPMYVVLTHFVQSQILEQFARETAATIGVPLSSLFDVTVSHLQKKQIRLFSNECQASCQKHFSELTIYEDDSQCSGCA